MAFDPRCVAFEGHLHADRRTAEYVGRANHDADAACFRSSRAASARARSPALRVFYYETQIMATSGESTPELAANSLPVRLNHFNSSLAIRRHAAQDRDAAATTARDRRRRAELEAMNLEDVEIPAINGSSDEESVNYNFSLNFRTAQRIRSRMDRRRLRRSNERKKFNHKIAVGFVLDEAEQKLSDSGAIFRSFSGFSRSSGFLENRVSRRAVKQLMQRILPDVAAGDDSEFSSEEEEAGEQKRKSGKKHPAILHQDLGEMVNSLAYVGKTGCVRSHGKDFLQCERYGAGDVVGCGVLLDTNTFFFTLNGKLMGMLAARDVYDLDDFGEVEESDVEESEEDETDSGEEDEGNGGDADNGVSIRVDMTGDVDMEDIDGRHEVNKALYPTVSLHGPGECVQAVFEPDGFQFDLGGFEQQIQKERQRALLEERDKRSENGPPRDVEQSNARDEAAMNELVQDFLLHYGYESAYRTFESALAPSKRQSLPSDSMEIDCDNEAEASTITLGVSSVEEMEDESKMEDMDSGVVYSPKKEQMRESLSLRHEVQEHIRCYRTAQALVVLEQHAPALIKNGTGYCSRRFRKLKQYCRILCVVDILTHENETKVAIPLSTNGVLKSTGSMGREEMQCNGWNPEPAIEFAQQIFGASSVILTNGTSTNGATANRTSPNGTTTNGKRKRPLHSHGSQERSASANDVALVMSLLLYDKRESIPATSHAKKFLTPEFRESVADQLNSLLLSSVDCAKAEEPRVSALETFMNDLESLQKECLHQGCRVYPECIEATSSGKGKTPSRRRRASVSSSSDDSSSSQSEQDDRLEDDDDEDDE